MARAQPTLVVPGRLANVARIRRWLKRVLSGWRLPEEATSELLVAVTEVCTNIIRHGYQEESPGRIELTVSREEDSIVLTIVDDAPPFVVRRESGAPPPEALAEGGYGLALIENLADEVRREPLGEKGNRTTLVKRGTRGPAETS